MNDRLEKSFTNHRSRYHPDYICKTNHFFSLDVFSILLFNDILLCRIRKRRILQDDSWEQPVQMQQETQTATGREGETREETRRTRTTTKDKRHMLLRFASSLLRVCLSQHRCRFFLFLFFFLRCKIVGWLAVACSARSGKASKPRSLIFPVFLFFFFFLFVQLLLRCVLCRWLHGPFVCAGC